jgi:CHASE2 domain-containing sensor protein
MGKQQKRMPGDALLRVALYVVLSAAVLLTANWIRLMNAVGIDNLLERQLLSFASHTVNRSIGENIRLIYLEEKGNGDVGDFSDESNRQCLRQTHGDLLRKLKSAGARVVAFDLVFPPAIQKCVDQSQSFVAAIRDVRQDGTMRVIIGHDPKADVDSKIRDEIKLENLALARVGRGQRDAEDKRFLTSVLLAEADEIPGAPGTTFTRPMPIALSVFIADRWAGPDPLMPGLVPSDRQVTFTPGGNVMPPVAVDVRHCDRGDLNCPLTAGATRHWYAFLPVWMGDGAAFTERSYASVFLQPELGDDYRDKIIMIGARTADEVVALDADSKIGTIWGYQVHARAVADLMSNSYLRRPPFWVVAVFLVVLVIVGISARLWLPKLEARVSLPWVGSTPIPLGLILVAGLHGFLMILLMRQWYWLQDIGYQLLALAAGYYFASRPLLPKTA